LGIWIVEWLHYVVFLVQQTETKLTRDQYTHIGVLWQAERYDARLEKTRRQIFPAAG
jgi:hypothetical protein